MAAEKKTLFVMHGTVSITAGVPVQLSATSLLTTSIFMESHRDNTGLIYYSDSSANALAGALSHVLSPCDKTVLTGDNHKGQIYPIDLSDVWVDASTNSDLVVSYIRRANQA